jgi:hypothetical protein
MKYSKFKNLLSEQMEPEPEKVQDTTKLLFKVGDVLVLANDKKSGRMPEDAYDFLTTFKTYTVQKVNPNGKIDIGCKICKNEPEGGVEKIYMFSPKRFKLKNN